MSSTSSTSSSPLSLNLPSQSFQEFELPNGIKLIVEPDHTSPVVSIQAWCAAGSITEGQYLGSGISHILEHMLFKGTKRRDTAEVAQAIQRLGGYTNAYTSFDRTVYYIDLPSKGWKEGLDVLSDAVFNSTLPEDEYKKEMEVVRREFAMGFDDPSRTMQKLLFSTAFTTHPYRYPVIGHLDVFNQLTRDDVWDYYKKLYVPNNLTFIIVGDVDPESVKEELTQLTKDIPRGFLEDVYIPKEPKQLGRREAHRPFHTDVTRMVMAYHIPSITHPDIYALDVLAILAGQGKSSRFHRELVEEKKLLRSISTYSYTPSQSGLWIITSLFHPDSTISKQEIENEITTLIQKFQTQSVSPQELEKAKRLVISDQVNELKTVSGKASSLGSSWFAAKDLHFSTQYIQKIGEVTAGDIKRVAQTYLLPHNLTVTSLNPESQIKETKQTRSENQTDTVQNITLSNGISLISKQDPKIPLVTVRAIARGGLLTETPENNGIGMLMARLTTKGTLSRSAEKIALTIENLGGSYEAHSGNNTFILSIEVLEQDLEQAVTLLADMTLNPSFPEEEIRKEKKKQLADIKLQRDKPMALAREKLRQTLFGSHPYALDLLGTEESLEKISQANLKDYHDALLKPSQMVFSIGGSFKPDHAKELFERHFPKSAFSQTGSSPSIPAPQFQGKGQTEIIPTPKRQAIVEIGYPGIAADSPDRAALILIEEALSNMASRLFLRIREEKALAYFVGASQLIGLDPGYFMFYAGTEKSKAQLVKKEILDEVNQLVSEGLTPEEFERAKAKLIGQRLLENQSADMIAFKGAINELYGLGIEYEQTLNEKIEALTLEEANAIARKYFSTSNYVCVIVQPEIEEDK